MSTSKSLTLKDVAHIVMGQSPSGDDCNRSGVGLPLLNGPTEFGPTHPYPTQFTTDGRKQALPGDLLFCVRGSTTGKMNWADQKYSIGRGIAGIRHKTNPKLQPLIRAAVEYQLPILLQAATGSTFPNVSGPQLAAVPFPDLQADQAEAIAATLGALDDKIELNRQMNATLEAMARALFRDWFVDFGPTHRKAAGATDPSTILGHLLPDPSQAPVLAASFPDHLGVDGLPVGWKLSAIGDVAKNHSETMDLKKRQRVIFINTGDVSEGTFLHANYSEAKGLPGQAKKKIEVGDILYSEIRPKNKRFAFVDFSAPDHVVSTKFMVLRTTSTVSPMHLYFLVSSPEAVEEINRIAESRSGTFPQITFESIKHYPVTLANDEVMKAFSQILELFYGLQRANDQENKILAQTRDLLLPRLMSGDLRVAELVASGQEAVA